MRIAVVGAGIAGLTAAVALARRGFLVEVFEQALRLEEIGAGIQLSPNAMAVLAELGVTDHLRGVVFPQAIEIRDGLRGKRLARIPLGETVRHRYGAPYGLVHRADLQVGLLAAAADCERIAVHLGAAVSDVSARMDEIALVAGGQSFSVDVLVGADGVHSRLRTGHFGHPWAEVLQRLAWRATLPMNLAPDRIPRDRTGLWLAPGAHLVHYPLRSGTELNLVVIADRSTSPSPPSENFGAGARDLIDAAPAWMSWPLYAVDQGRRFSMGRAVLIGDAAHAMPPTAAQAGAQAIEDAYVLARSLAESTGSVEQRLAGYENARRARVARVVRESRRNFSLYNLSGMAALARNAAIAALPSRLHLARLDWLYGWRPGQKP